MRQHHACEHKSKSSCKRVSSQTLATFLRQAQHCAGLHAYQLRVSGARISSAYVCASASRMRYEVSVCGMRHEA